MPKKCVPLYLKFNYYTMKKVNLSIVILTVLMAFSSCQKKSSENQILEFRFASHDVVAIIDEGRRSIKATFPYGTDVTALTPIIVVSNQATVFPESGMTMDFTNPVTYTVTAEDGSQSVYIAVVTKEKNSEKRILAFRFASLSVDADINEDTKEIEATVPYGTDVTTLVPTIIISEDASIEPSSDLVADFSQPVTYTVTAEDGSQVTYVVTVIVEEPENPFLGVWGVEKIEYYTTDYAGNPIAASMITYLYEPYSTDNGIQMYFREDDSGEIRDSAIEELWLDWNEETESYETHIICPDTVLVKPFTYIYDESGNAMYITLTNDGDVNEHTLKISDLSNEVFVYEDVYGHNDYGQSYVEKAYLRRVNIAATKSTGKSLLPHPHKMHGSILGDR